MNKLTMDLPMLRLHNRARQIEKLVVEKFNHNIYKKKQQCTKRLSLLSKISHIAHRSKEKPKEL